ncbi:MAG: penicillin-binding protein 2, partial [Phyllobacterium sp.]|nr:penicillin-binding protein 2 [Phyllobacterium sp.]
MGIWIKRKTAQLENGTAPAFEMDARKKKTGNRARNRVMMAMICFIGIYGVISGRLIFYGMQEDTTGYNGPTGTVLASRPDILDRNGEVLATDI